jgi:hypothetical protein
MVSVQMLIDSHGDGNDFALKQRPNVYLAHSLMPDSPAARCVGIKPIETGLLTDTHVSTSCYDFPSGVTFVVFLSAWLA